MADLMRLEHFEDFQAIGEVGLVARRAERGGRRVGDRLEIEAGLARQIDEFLVDDAAHAERRAIDALDPGKFAGLQRDADQRLVDHRGRPAALRDKNLRHESFPLRSACLVGATPFPRDFALAPGARQGGRAKTIGAWGTRKKAAPSARQRRIVSAQFPPPLAGEG
jgi:hypothetical protein